MTVGEVDPERADPVAEQLLERAAQVAGPLAVQSPAETEVDGPSVPGGVDLHAYFAGPPTTLSAFFSTSFGTVSPAFPPRPGSR